MTELRCSNSRDPCFNCRISYDFGGDYKMFRTVLIAKPEVLLAWSLGTKPFKRCCHEENPLSFGLKNAVATTQRQPLLSNNSLELSQFSIVVISWSRDCHYFVDAQFSNEPGTS